MDIRRIFALVIQWVGVEAPRDFGGYRSGSTCVMIVAWLENDYGLRTSRKTVRCRLNDEGPV